MLGGTVEPLFGRAVLVKVVSVVLLNESHPLLHSLNWVALVP